jgi:ABC-2 type transport system permease protein
VDKTMKNTFNTIYILWLRQIKRYLRSKPRIIGSLAQPLLFLLALGFGFGPIYSQAGGGDYIQFLAPGIVAMSVLFTSIFSGIDLIWDRKFGFLKATLVAPVSRLSIMFGRTLGGATVGFAQGLIVLLITFFVGFRPENYFLLPLAFVFIFLEALLFTALGTAIASVLEDMHSFPLVMNLLVMPLFFLSGALFPLSNLPRGIQLVSFADPMSYAVDGLRGALTGETFFSFSLSLLVLSSASLFILIIGAGLFKRIEA